LAVGPGRWRLAHRPLIRALKCFFGKMLFKVVIYYSFVYCTFLHIVLFLP
jgi:hypothetical protein